MLRYLYRRGQLKGLLGGSRGWTAVWGVLLAARLFKKASTRDAKVVYTEVLHPGETVVIRHEDAAPKRKRR
ncbi:hypothetical protein BH24ACT1_BH24ACT1_08460 [soil metagenome]